MLISSKQVHIKVWSYINYRQLYIIVQPKQLMMKVHIDIVVYATESMAVLFVLVTLDLANRDHSTPLYSVEYVHRLYIRGITLEWFRNFMSCGWQYNHIDCPYIGSVSLVIMHVLCCLLYQKHYLFKQLQCQWSEQSSVMVLPGSFERVGKSRC